MVDRIKGFFNVCYKQNSVSCNVLSGIEVDGKSVSVDKVSGKTIYQMSVKLKFSNPNSQSFLHKSSRSLVRAFGPQFIYFLPGYQ